MNPWIMVLLGIYLFIGALFASFVAGVAAHNRGGERVGILRWIKGWAVNIFWFTMCVVAWPFVIAYSVAKEGKWTSLDK